MVAAAGLPMCPGFLAPVCGPVAGAGSAVLGAGAGAVLSAMAGWVVTGASWLLDRVGGAMSSTTRIDLTAGWFGHHYQAMAGIAMAVALPMLLVAAVQAVYRQSPSVLVRAAFVQLPLAALLTGVAVQLVQFALVATDALCSTVAGGAEPGLGRALSGLSTVLVTQSAGGPDSAPLFVLLLGALLVAGGAFALWLELLVRAGAVYVAVVFLPLALATLVWPAVAHWCRRLVDTLVALVLSKFVIVAVLSLAVGGVGAGSGAGFSTVLAGGALLLLAAFAPFALLRLVPAVEAGAVHQLEGARHRVRQVAGPLPASAAAHALRAARDGRQPLLVPGTPGTGDPSLAADGASPPTWAGDEPPALGEGSTGGAREAGGGEGSGAPAPGEGAVADLAGDPRSERAFWDVVRSPRPPPTAMRGTGGILPGATALPVWSTPGDPEGAEGPTVAHPGPGRPDEPLPGAGRMLVGHDELGPVIRRVPGDPVGPGGGPGDGAPGAGPAGGPADGAGGG